MTGPVDSKTQAHIEAHIGLLDELSGPVLLACSVCQCRLRNVDPTYAALSYSKSKKSVCTSNRYRASVTADQTTGSLWTKRPGVPEMTPLEILLVEDSEFMAMRVTEALENTHNMNLTAVGTAAEARERLEVDDYDCVVVNYELPDETGIELAQSVNPSGTDPVVPVILLTGKELEPIARDAIQKGVTEFVYKGDHAAGEMDVLENRIRLTVRAYGNRDRGD